MALLYSVMPQTTWAQIAPETLPSGGQVTFGAASFATNGNTLGIHQTTDKAAINWNSFSIGSDATVNFHQPSASALTLNRVVGNESSIIDGALNANGQVFILNSNGVLFNKSARVNTGGLVASTLNMSDTDFNAGRYTLEGSGGTVTNKGALTAKEGGYIALAGGEVRNEGTITANMGSAVLASGDKVSLQLDGDALANITVDKATLYALVENKQAIVADGGQVILKTKAAETLLKNVVNNTGVIQARTLSKRNGVVRLEGSGGITRNAGKIDVSGKAAAQKAGSAHVLGTYVEVAPGSAIDAAGDAGGGTVRIGGDYQGLNAAIPNALYTFVGKDSVLDVSALGNGHGGKAILWADNNTQFFGDIAARGGALGGDGGFVEVSGKRYLDYKGLVDTTAAFGETGTLLLDPTDIIIANGTVDSAADGTNTFAGTPSGVAGTIASGDTGPTTIYESELQGIGATTNISLTSTNSITINDLTDNNLNLAQNGGRTVTFSTGAGGFSMLDTNDTITLAGGALNITTTGGTSNIGNISTGGGLTTFNVGGTATVAGVIGGTGGVTKTGTGTLALNGNNTYSGTTTLTTGTIQVGHDNALGTGTLSFNGGTLQGDGTSRSLSNALSLAANSTIGGSSALAFGGLLTGTNSLSLTNNNNGGVSFNNINISNSATNRTLTFAGTGTTTVNGVIANGSTSTASAISKSGTGTLILNGTNTHGGATTVSAGTLQIGNSAAAGSGTLTLSGGTVQGDGTSRTLNNAVSLTASTTIGGNSDLTFTNTLTGSNSVTLTNNNTGTTSLGAVDLSNSATNRTLTVSGTGNTIISGAIANGSTSTAGALSKSGTGTLTLSGNNTYDGLTTVSAGTLIANGDNSGATGGVTLTGGTFQAGTDNALGSGTLTFNGGTIQGNGSPRAFSNAMSLAAGSTISGSSALTFSGLLAGTTSLTLTNNNSGGTSFGNVNISNSATSRTLTIAGTGDTSITGVIANGSTATASALTKTGTGTLTLSGANTYGGATTINNGTLRLGANNALPNTAVTVNSTTAGATALLDLNGFNNTIASLTFGGTGATSTSTNNVTTGAGTLTLGGNVTYTNTNNPLGSNISGNLALGGSTRTFTINDSSNATAELTVDAIISGTGGLTKAGAGALVLNGNNTYSGTTTLTTGTIQVGHDNAVGTGTLTLNGGTIQGNGALRTISNAITYSAASIVAGASDLLFSGIFSNTASNVTLTNNNSATTTFSNTVNIANSATSRTLTIAGTGNTNITGVIANGSTATASALTKTGTGTLTLSGANTYGGATTINNGTLRLGANDALPNTAVTVNSTTAGATALLDLNGFNDTIGSLTFGGTGATSTSTNNVTTGAGTLTLGGNVTYTNTNNPLGSTISGNLALGGSTRTFTINDSSNATAELTIDAIISGTGGLTKAGAGALILNGNNTYSGTTTLSAGNLRATQANALGAGNLSLGGGTLELAADSNTNFGRNTTVTAATTVTTDRLNSGTAVTHTLGTLSQGAFTLTTNAGSNIASGTAGLTFGATTLTGNPTFSVGTGSQLNLGALTDSGVARTITKLGAGILKFLSAASSWATASNALTINNGEVELGATNAFGTGTNTNVTVNSTTAGNTALFDLNGFNQSIGTLIFGGTGATSTSTNNVTTGAGTLTLGGDVTYTSTNDPLGSTISGNLALGGSTRTFTINDSGSSTAELAIDAIISGTGGLTKAGAGMLTLSGANTYTGTTTINAGTLTASGGSAIIDTGAVSLANTAGAVLVLNGNETIGSLAGGGGTGGNVTLGSNTLTTGDASNTTYSGVISGTGGLTKVGAGIFTLSGANTYTGATNVNAGTLALGAADRLSNSSALSVASGATFDFGSFSETLASITSAGTVTFGTGNTITTSGAQSYTGAVTGNGTLLVSTSGGNITANNTTNDFSGDIGISTTGNASIVDANALSLGAIDANVFTARALGGNLTLNNQINTTGTSGTPLTLTTSGNFINNFGATALQTGVGGRWLVYSSSPLTDTRGGLSYDFKQYNATYGDSILGSDNGLIYTVAPSLTPSLTSTVSRTYNGTTSATLAGANYSSTGAIDGDTVTLTGSSANFDYANAGTGKTVTANGISVTSATNGAATVYGYQLGSTTANASIGTITPANLTLSTSDVTKTYDGTLSALGTAIVTGGTLFTNVSNGSVLDSISGGTFAFTDPNAGTGKTVTVSGVTISDGNAGANYNVTYANNTSSTIIGTTTTSSGPPATITNVITAILSDFIYSPSIDGGLSAIGTATLQNTGNMEPVPNSLEDLLAFTAGTIWHPATDDRLPASVPRNSEPARKKPKEIKKRQGETNI